MKTRELFEVFDASTPSKDLPNIAKALILDWRAMAAKHDLTIDGSSDRSAHESLPIARKSFMLFGGRIKAKGTMKQEAKRKVPLQERVKAFLAELWPTLKRLQIKALNDDLGTNYTVLVRVDDGKYDDYHNSRMFKPVLKTSVDECFNALRFKNEHGGTGGTPQFAIFTWKLEINK